MKKYFENTAINLADKGQFTGPLSRYISGIAVYLWFIVFAESLLNGSFILSLLLILPLMYFHFSIFFAIYFLLSGQYFELILIILFLILIIISVVLGRRNAKKIVKNEKTIYSDFKILTKMSMFRQYMLLSVLIVSFKFLDIYFPVIFLSVFIYFEIKTVIDLKSYSRMSEKFENTEKDLLNFDNIFEPIDSNEFNLESVFNSSQDNSGKVDFKTIENSVNLKEFISDVERIEELNQFTNESLKKVIKDQHEFLYYPNGIVKSISRVDNLGVKNGEFWMYYDDGNLFSKGNYKNDLLDGEVINYFKNGIKSSIINYKIGKMHGSCILYYPNSDVQMKFNYENNIMIDSKSPPSPYQ